MYVCGLGDIRALFMEKRKDSTTLMAGVASLAKSVLEYHGGFLCVRLHRCTVRALFFIYGK